MTGLACLRRISLRLCYEWTSAGGRDQAMVTRARALVATPVNTLA